MCNSGEIPCIGRKNSGEIAPVVGKLKSGEIPLCGGKLMSGEIPLCGGKLMSGETAGDGKTAPEAMRLYNLYTFSTE